MDDYVEDYKYNNCFWMKSGLLYSHAEDKFKEFYSTGTMLNQFSILCKNFYEGLNKIPNLYKPVEKDENSTRYAGIQAIIRYINQIAQNIKSLYSDIEKIASTIFERQYAYESKKNYIDLCEKDHKQYQDELTKLKLKKESYFDAINKAIETHLTNKFKGKQKKINPKIVADVNKKKTEYKEQISSVDKFRVEYMNVQGNIFAYEEEFEKQLFSRDLLKNINQPTEEDKAISKKYLDEEMKIADYRDNHFSIGVDKMKHIFGHLWW